MTPPGPPPDSDDDHGLGNEAPRDSSRSVISLIRDLKNGILDSASMAVKDRRLCVTHLTTEGYSIPEIAEILKIGERTLFRDRAAIRQANSIDAGPELTSQMVGHLLAEADNTVNRIRRATRGAAVTTTEKIDGERTCWTVTKELTQSLQRLGYLPSAPQQITGQVTHQFGEIEAPGYEDLEQELDRLASIFNAGNTVQANGEGHHGPGPGAGARTGAVMDEIVQVKDTITRLTLSRQIQLLSTRAGSEMVVDAVGAEPTPQDKEGINGQAE